MLQKNIIKNLAKFFSLIKRKNTKQIFLKEGCAKSNLVYNDFTFYKYHNTKEFGAKHSFDAKENELKVLFYLYTIEIKPNNKDPIKDSKKKSFICYTF